MTGYLHPGYAESLAEFGKPRPLPRCGGHLVAREIPNTDWMDAMGCYPLFYCRDWTRLREDLEGLCDRLVSEADPDPIGSAYHGHELAGVQPALPWTIVSDKV
jgi:hypothetical protein